MNREEETVRIIGEEERREEEMEIRKLWRIVCREEEEEERDKWCLAREKSDKCGREI